MVGLSPYSLLHDEKYFPEPFVFRPERHLEAEQNGKKATDAARAFAHFGIGSRSCRGRAVAYLEASLTIATILWYFDVEKAAGRLGELGEGCPGMGRGRERRGEYQIWDVITAERHGPNLVFKGRGEHWEELVKEA